MKILVEYHATGMAGDKPASSKAVTYAVRNFLRHYRSYSHGMENHCHVTINVEKVVFPKEKSHKSNPTSTSLRVICPMHGETDATAFVMFAAMTLQCGCKVISVQGVPWRWEFAPSDKTKGKK